MRESKLYGLGFVYSRVGEVRLKPWAFIMKVVVVVAMETASSPKQPDG